MKRIIEFKSVRLGYNKKVVLDSLDFEIYEGEFLSIVGPNGSGKTTILRSIMGLLKPQAGQITRDKTLRFGYCMQRQSLDTILPFTVYEVVMMVRTSLIGPLRSPRSIDKSKVLKALEITGVSELAREPYYNLSGGQKQRVLLARALASEPNVLTLDEPTADLDVKAKREILDIIKKLHQEQKITVILVTHELNEAINIAQKFIFLNKSTPCKVFANEELNGNLLSEIFGIGVTLKEIGGRKLVY